MITPQQKAALDMLAVSEIGEKLLAISDNGYNVIVGSTPAKPILFSDYSRHPRMRVDEMDSDAAGRYQFLGRYWEHYRQQLGLPDFGPDSQDRWALQLIRECHALDDIEAGRIVEAIIKCRSRWASLPGAGYGQHENAMSALVAAFMEAGGAVT
jgi:muramidase (phage lysozyme)